MPRWKSRCEESRFNAGWILVLAAFFVITKQTFGVPTSWWWMLAIIPLGTFLEHA